jgi:hypothetical protein
MQEGTYLNLRINCNPHPILYVHTRSLPEACVPLSTQIKLGYSLDHNVNRPANQGMVDTAFGERFAPRQTSRDYCLTVLVLVLEWNLRATAKHSAQLSRSHQPRSMYARSLDRLRVRVLVIDEHWGAGGKQRYSLRQWGSHNQDLS